jgi:hypothetical protein
MKTNKQQLVKAIEKEIEIAYTDYKDGKAKTLEWTLELINRYIQDEEITTPN